MSKKPFECIQNNLSELIPKECLKKLPRKWEKIGNICLICLNEELTSYADIIGEAYATVLDCKSVLRDLGGIEGVYRLPQVKVIYGDEDTETVHKENGVSFVIDPSKVMYSSGNLDERKRMSTIANHNEVIVDMFAGIGYFSIPMAVHVKPKKIYACEINPVAYGYLCKNIQMNDVACIIDPLFGDSLFVAPENVADRVVMGYLGGTDRFFLKALSCLKEKIGMVHFHDTFPDEKIPDKPMETLKEKSKLVDCDLELVTSIRVKSYAPGIGHYVFDIRVG